MEDGEGVENQETIEKQSESLSKSRQKVEELNKSKESILSNQDFKYELPESCLITIMKGCKIEKLHKKYVLLAHPYPLLEGEMIMFQPIKEDKKKSDDEKDILIYRDYSLRKRFSAPRPNTKKLTPY